MPFVWKVLTIVLVAGAIGAVAYVRDPGPPGPALYAYGTSYLAGDIVNSPGRRYIDQFDGALEPSEFHNFARDGATVQQIAASVDDTWRSRPAIVVIDAVTNNLYQTRADPARGIADAEPVFRSMVERLGSQASIIIVKQGRLSEHDYALFDHELSDETVDAWNAMIDRAVAGLPNVRVVDPNVGWDPNTMMHNVHPTDDGEDHIARLLFATAGLVWQSPACSVVFPDMDRPAAGRRIGFLAPMKPELRPLVQMLSMQRDPGDGPPVYRKTFGDTSVVATLTLIGTKAAGVATERLLKGDEIDHVVVVGIAGGVPPTTRLGDVLVPEVVVDAETGKEYRAAALGDTVMSGRVRTSDDVNVKADDLLAEGVAACDMETAAVAAVCEAKGIPWTAFRAISDLVGGPVDDALLKLANPDGTGNMWAAAKYLLPRPWKIPGLARLARDTGVATKAAASAAVQACGLTPPS